MVENRNDLALQQKNTELEQRVQQHTLANEELRKFVDKLKADTALVKAQVDGAAAEKADADAKFEAQTLLERELIDKSEDLQRKINTMTIEVEKLSRVAATKYSIDDF